MLPAINNGPVGLLAINQDNTIAFANRKLLDLFQLHNESIIGQMAKQVFSKYLKMPSLSVFDYANYEMHYQSYEPEVTIGDQSVNFLIQTERCLESNMVLLAVSDISHIKKSQNHMIDLASHDMLTGLLNRNALLAQLGLILKTNNLRNKSVALLFIDLDNFKMINEGMGNDAGDHVLVKAADRIKSCLRAADLAVRYGGDEFIVVLSGFDNDEFIRKMVWHISLALRIPIEYKDYELSISASIGVSTYPMHGDTPSSLIQAANIAMNHAKLNGKNDSMVFQSDMLNEKESHYHYSALIRKGVRDEEFFFHYQPQVSLETLEIVGYEALIRWACRDVLVSPDHFIPLAESTGQIIEIGEMVASKVIHQMAQWLDQGRTLPSISINLSPRHFCNQRIVDHIDGLLRNTGVNPALLTVELTENALILDHQLAKQSLNALKSLGIKLSLDDFGTGYSSLCLVSEYDFDELKIDRTFVRDIHTRTDHATMVSAIVSMCHKLNKSVVAEGIETLQHHEILKGMGCSIGQGYYYSKPISHELVGL